MAKSYTPDRGDVVWINLGPQAGHEQSGRRPALVVSPLAYNAKVGLGLFCPLTTQVKGYPFEVVLTREADSASVVLADQIKSLDWGSRKAEFMKKLPNPQVEEVLKRIRVLLQ
ncbi:MAG: endoribonuclease MazF [Armatimonadetes bacterium]|nr:endoribonuclease MazF [Armatimonadota bacterium]